MSYIIEAYTDGSCLGNPGKGAWGVVVLMSDGTTHEVAKPSLSTTTSNMMELGALIRLAEFLDRVSPLLIGVGPILVYSDSKYVVRGTNEWLANWKRRGWTLRDGKPLANKEYWIHLDKLLLKLRGRAILLEVVWVKAHATNKYNNRVDELARSVASGKSIGLVKHLVLKEFDR